MSSNKTANLQLNQWQAGDAFLREEFNQDNGKIDAAVQGAKDAAGAAVNAVKLLDMTTQTAMQKINIDVSGLNLTAYREVKLWVEGVITPEQKNARIQLNNIADNVYDYSSGGSYGKTDGIVGFITGPQGSVAGHSGGCVVVLRVVGGVLVAECTSVAEEHYQNVYTSSVGKGYRSISPRLLKPEALSSIQIATNPATAISPGVHIIIVGEKL